MTTKAVLRFSIISWHESDFVIATFLFVIYSLKVQSKECTNIITPTKKITQAIVI